MVFSVSERSSNDDLEVQRARNEHEPYRWNAREFFIMPSTKTTLSDSGSLTRTLTQVDPILQNLRPVLLILRALGVMPLHLSSTGEATFAIKSPAMVYSVCIYMMVIVALYFTFNSWIAGILSGSPEFSEALFGILGIILELMVICVPFLNWRETKFLALLLCDWNKIQMQYNRVRYNSHQCPLQRRCTVLCIVLTCVMGIQQVVYEILAYENLSWWNYRDIIVYCYVYEVRNMLALFWFLLCYFIATSARKILQQLRKDLLSSPRSGYIVADYRHQWLELSRMATRIGNTTCYTYCFYLLYLMATLTIYVYYLIFMLIEGISGNLAWLAIETVLTTVLLFMICDGANRITREAGEEYRQFLLTIRIDPEYKHIHHEVDVFLKVMGLHPPVVVLNGYVIVNRSLLTSVGSTLVTYLVVLVQFRLATKSSSE